MPVAGNITNLAMCEKMVMRVRLLLNTERCINPLQYYKAFYYITLEVDMSFQLG